MITPVCVERLAACFCRNPLERYGKRRGWLAEGALNAGYISSDDHGGVLLNG